MLCRLVPIAALALLVLPLDAQRRGQGRSRGPEKLDHFTFSTHEFKSGSLEKNLPYGVYLPKGYEDAKNKDRRYPLVVWLHGMWEDHRRFHSRGGAVVLDGLAAKKQIPEFVLVTANGDRSSFYTNGLKSGAWEDAIAIDLLAHIDAKYRVERKRSHRAIIGVSMGGYGALKIALTNPNLFGVVCAHSAAVMPRDHETLEVRFPWLKRFGGSRGALGGIFGDPVDEKKWVKENLLFIGDDLDPKELGGLKIYFDCGDKDRYAFDEPNLELHALLKKKKIKHTWRLVKGGDHGWRAGYNQKAIPHSLEFTAAAWAAAKGTSGLEGLLRGGSGKGRGR